MTQIVDLSGRVALVAGGSRGIGAAAAHALARAGARVAVAARSAVACREIATEIADFGGEAEAFECDVADYGSVASLVAGVVDRFGALDIVVNNAGVIEPIGLITDIDPTVWARNISVNLVGAFNVVHASLPHLIEASGTHAAGGGILLNVSSGAADKPYEGWSAYCAGKAGLAMVTRSVAMETEGTGLRCVGVRPGVVDTDMQVSIRASGINPVSGLPRDSLLPVTAPADLIVWLCGSDAADTHAREIDIRDPDIQKRANIRVA
ncbi:SDR family NAD(P)-dependent oxidoreductase [Fodinicurvata sp. EGI_FJ10296]|uniref:SDR family NAD(P)-dependent oxidoreductase n=1 Tax=Fodinicurvata sp. EGI_FJ10296 TaxID=3231908 RepID=UPI0034521C47